MSEPTSGTRLEPQEDLELATDVARDVRSFLETLELVASGRAGDQAVALLLLDVAQMCVAGAHLGADRGQGQGPLLPGLRQRQRAGRVPGLP